MSFAIRVVMTLTRQVLTVTLSFAGFAVLFFFTFGAHAKTTRLEIPPMLTNSGILQATSPHLALRDDDVPASGLLVITLGGTNSRTSDFQYVHEVALAEGHFVLGIDYPNNVISTTCRDAAPTCFDQFRAEVATGVSGSEIVQVDAVNSIISRIQALMRFLSNRDERWSHFMIDGGVDWNKVILMGHSQGSGHAAYLSKFVSLKRLVLFAGPQDSHSKDVASWTHLPGKTAPERIYAFLHAKDFFDVKLQMKVNEALHDGQKLQISRVSNGSEPQLTSVIVSERPAQDGHHAVLYPPNQDVFRKLLDLEF